ncbi:HAD family hydrolase [Marinicrinis sediminis]|uniref:Phosphoserine phosphatase n=1 Tax=Marinicrinis sediminis TaxID=1652465 RepID=A0ABW5RE91_9BACL
MAIKAVWFDLDDTLLWDARSVQESFEVTCEKAAMKYAELDAAKLEEAVREAARDLYAGYETYGFTQNIGINPFEGLWGNFRGETHEMFHKMEQIVPQYRTDAWTKGLKALGIEDAELGHELGEMFAAERRKRPYTYEETYTILDELKESYKLVLLTNGSPDLQNEKLSAVPELAPYFDLIMISGKFGKGKPSPELFEHVMEEVGVSADEAIMVGDKLTTDIKGANSVGITSVWINRENHPPSDEIKPVYEIKHLSELHGILKELNAKQKTKI